tara:strand:- start:2574 stop:2996 length:423 start_codon:yes stop_codon:yes gene_type:complete
MAADYTITHDKGTTFKFHALYKSATGGAINLAGQSARMQVRRSPDDTQLALFITGSGVTGGGSTGEFAVGSGIGGTGGITLNGSNSGAAGTTGGIYVEFDAVSSSNLPTGRMFYDFELVNGEEITRLLQGRFEATANITR